MRPSLPPIIVALVIGAAVTIVIAWVHAACVDGLPVRQLHEGERGVSRAEFPRWEVLISRTRGSTVIRHMPVKETTPVPPPPLRDGPGLGGVDLWVKAKAAYDRGLPPPEKVQQSRPVVDVPYWSRASHPPRERYFGSSAYTSTYIEDARGWPFRALVSYHDTMPGGASAPAAARRWRLNLGGEQGPTGLKRGFPLNPIALGFLADTMIFGAAAYVILALLVVMRTCMRQQRGRCPHCGYNLRGRFDTGCSECGWGRSREVTTRERTEAA